MNFVYNISSQLLTKDFESMSDCEVIETGFGNSTVAFTHVNLKKLTQCHQSVNFGHALKIIVKNITYIQRNESDKS